MASTQLVPDSLPTENLDGSITESFAQLGLSGGSISRLPNKLVQFILVRLEMQKLIRLQVVCKKWQAVIYSIGHTKKSLYLGGFSNRDSLMKRSFGQIDLNTFTRVNLKSNFKSSKHFQSQFVKLFPSVEQLVVAFYWADIIYILDIMSLNQLTTLVFPKGIHDKSLLTRINSCTSLKRLDIFAQIKLLPTLAPTFARLEQFSCQRFDLEGINDYANYEDDGLSLIRHFGPNCSRVWIDNYHVANSALWYTTNSQWLAGVTHLSLDYVDIDEVIRDISEYAVSLQVLHLRDFIFDVFSAPNSQTIGKLNKLTHLTEIALNSFSINRTQVEEAARNPLFQLPPYNKLASIRF